MKNIITLFAISFTCLQMESQDLTLNANNSLLGNDGSGTFTQLIFWTGSNAYYGRNALGAGVDNMYFRTNGIDRLMISYDGNIGIGTTTPTSKLFIKQKLENSNGGLSISDLSGRLIRIYGEGPSGRQVIATSSTANPLAFDLDDVEKMRLTSAGNLGLGTTSPTGKLEILKNADLSSSITLPNSGLIIRADNDGNDASLRFGVDDTNLKAVIQTQQTTTAAKFDLLLNPFGGDIGIGTTVPDAKLAVKGNIHAQEVLVDLNGAVAPDYVFKEDYKLKSLEEVKDYIKENGHLPNIPSATEMEGNGIELGEMNMKLLEKIEELTLYILQQENRIEQLETTIKKMDND